MSSWQTVLMKSRSWETRTRVGVFGPSSRRLRRYFCSQMIPRRSRKLVGSSRIKMSVGWRRALARFVLILHPPDKVVTGFSNWALENPSPNKMFRALTSMSAILCGSNWDWSSARRSLAACISSLIVSSSNSSSFWDSLSDQLRSARLDVITYFSVDSRTIFSNAVNALRAAIPRVPLRSRAFLSSSKSSFFRRSWCTWRKARRGASGESDFSIAAERTKGVSGSKGM